MFVTGVAGLTIASVKCGFATCPVSLRVKRILKALMATLMAPQILPRFGCCFRARTGPCPRTLWSDVRTCEYLRPASRWIFSFGTSPKSNIAGKCRAFRIEGTYVYIPSRRQKELDAAIAKIKYNVTGVQGDISKLEDLDRLYTKIAEEKGHSEIVVANAGIGNYRAPIGQITEEQVHKTFEPT
jgi:hypothetical protein